MAFGLSDFGDLIQAGGAILGAFEGDSAGKANAQAAREQAAREAERTRIELERHRQDVRKLKGTQTVQFAAAGVRLSGSALDVMADSAARAELDADLIAAGGELRESRALSEAREFERRGRAVFRSGLLSATSILLEDA